MNLGLDSPSSGEEIRYWTAHGHAWEVQPFTTRIVFRMLLNRQFRTVGSWRLRRDGSYQLFHCRQPVAVTDWLGASHTIIASDRAAALERSFEVLYYLVATPEYRSELDAHMTELVLWSQRHTKLTRRSPSIVGELGEFYAVKALGLAMASEREAGFDAWDRDWRRIQIKCRCVVEDEYGRPILNGKTLPAMRRDAEWDCLMLVLIDWHFRLKSIWKMDREDIEMKWPERTGSMREGKLFLSIGQFINNDKTNQVFGPACYRRYCLHPRRRLLPKGKLLSAMPCQIGQVAAHVEAVI